MRRSWLSGAEVARRAGLTATRYGHYLQNIREPDFATLVRICRVLGIRPDMLLAYDQAAPGPDALLAKRAAVAVYVDMLDAGSLDLAPIGRAGVNKCSTGTPLGSGLPH